MALATYFPGQGGWSEEEFLAFATPRRRLELVAGRVEVLPMPSDRHKAALMRYLNQALASLHKTEHEPC